MDVWDTFPQVSRRSNRRDHHPSFSSTLLDAIYRSIDDPNNAHADSIMRKNTHVNNPFDKSDDNSERLHRARKAVAGELVTVRRKSTAEYTDHRRTQRPNSNSSSASSDSSGGLSSSESDSLFYKPKPIRTSLISRSDADKMMNHHYSAAATHQKQQSKREGGFVRTKSKALKIYSDLKKVKQPISPGGRLASFLNSLFTAGNAKKAKMIYDEKKTTTKTADQQTAAAAASSSSTCSSASSFSRSCLSKTPSSRSGKTTTAVAADTKRSVTFYPVSVIVDEDCKPCGQKRLHENQMNQSDKELEFRILEENRRVVEAAKELLKSYHKKKLEFDNINGDHHHHHHHHKAGHVFSEDDDEEEDDDDDDDASCSSSDLFELDNLSAIGIERYREELPVYETTHLDTNRAIYC